MANETTETIGLELPSITDFYDVGVVNKNNKSIDKFFTDLKKAVDAHANSSHVTGVKGANETAYRNGNVNITAENIGLGNVDNTSDSEKKVLSAGKLTSTRLIDGIGFDGSKDVYSYGICSTSGATAAKTVKLLNDTFIVLNQGITVTVRFSNTNTAEKVTLNVNGTGAIPVYFGNAQAGPYTLVAGEEYKLTYNSGKYTVEGVTRTASSTTPGLMSSTDKAKLDEIKITGTEGDLFGKLFYSCSAVVTSSPAKIAAPEGYIPIAATNADWNAYPEITFDIVKQGGYNLLLTRSLKTGASDSGQYITGDGGGRRANILFVNRKFISGYDV